MTPAISTLLLLPGEGREGLLACDRVLGTRPPMLFKPPGKPWRGLPFLDVDITDWQRALVLAYEGEPVPEGCDRLARAWSTICVEEWVSGILAGRPQPQLPGGTLLALDPSGRDITAEVLGG